MSLPSADELEQLEEIGANFRSIDFGQKEKWNQFERFTKNHETKFMHHRHFREAVGR